MNELDDRTVFPCDESLREQASVVQRSGATSRRFAPAKINLTLQVGPRRDDGYHPIDSIVSRIALYDTLDFTPRKDGEIRLSCTALPCGKTDDNLVMRAARLLAGQGPIPGADISLAKHIPAGSGLGGGSSDAAAALMGLSRLWKLDLSAVQLHELAMQLGSDVPFFLSPPCVRMTGRGEKLQQVRIHPFYIVLVVPDIHCPTGEVYAAYDANPARPREPFRSEVLATAPSLWAEGIGNDLLEPARVVRPRLKAIHERLESVLARPVHMTGSGSGLFVLCDGRAQARETYRQLPRDLVGRAIITSNNAW
jgi:4-diphosphocytidyl-2-C-methyl-D-erythritol kinase